MDELDREQMFVPTAAPWNTTLSGALRVKFFLTGIIYPTCCLMAIAGGLTPYLGGDLWQDGDTDTYLALLLSAPAFCVFIPIILFSMIGLGVWCFRPNSYQNYWVRFSIFTGLVLTSTFNALLWYITFFLSPIMGTIFMVGQAGVIWLGGLLLPRKLRFTIAHVLILTTVLAVMLAVCVRVPNIGAEFILPFAASFFFMSCGAPFMAMVTFFRVAVAVNCLYSTRGLTEPSQFRPPNYIAAIGSSVAWLATWGVSWKLAIDLMLIEYAKLPTSPPLDCFVSQAAACGHPSLVGSAHNVANQVVSTQMARCKMLELVLGAVCPRLHRIARALYNKVGPPAAAVCRSNIWLADLAYLLLKPVELLAIAAQMLLRITNSQVFGLYEIPCVKDA